jgi:hypothetical protein
VVIKTEPEPQQKTNTVTNDALSFEEKELLKDILEEPDLSVTARTSRLGLSAYKMNALKKSLIKKGHVVQFKINIGKLFGGIVTLLGLTEEGFKELGKRPINKPEEMSWEHWWWQRAICDYFNKRGAKAEIEKSKNGKRADVGLVMNGIETAVEVELSPKNAISNITADLEAGFDKVVCCCKNTMVAKEVRRQLKAYSRYEAIKDKVEVKILTELQLVKELFGK